MGCENNILQIATTFSNIGPSLRIVQISEVAMERKLVNLTQQKPLNNTFDHSMQNCKVISGLKPMTFTYCNDWDSSQCKTNIYGIQRTMPGNSCWIPCEMFLMVQEFRIVFFFVQVA